MRVGPPDACHNGPAMTGLPLATERQAERDAVRISALGPLVLALSTAFVLIGLAGAAVATPWYLDGALDRAGSAANLGLPPDEVHALSSSVLAELFVGPGTFAQTVAAADGSRVPFFGANEAAHLRDVQLLARLLMAIVLVAVVIVATALARAWAKAWTWRAISRGAAGLALGLTGAGLLFAIAFEPAFTLFHVVFFPGGNWSFDPREARMVQLYPTPFWQEVVLVFAILAVGLALLLWAAARRRARSLEPA